MSSAVLQTNLPFPVRRGKVRDVYDLDDKLLIVATDRISAFDVIMPNGIPDKGRILTALSMFWFQKFTEQFENHLVRPDIREFSQAVRSLDPQIAARSMLVRKTKVIPIECVARGYLAGSGWKEYQQTQTVCGVALPAGLRQSDKLPQPIFTPATKEEAGHDINISFERAAEIVGKGVAETVRDRTVSLYQQAADYAATRGIIIADTKFEFGFVGDELVLGDEVLTPDSSRFWPADEYAPGGAQPSFDKQYVRDYCESLGWDKTAPGPELPDEVVAGTRARYVEAFERLTGISFDDYLRDPEIVLRTGGAAA